MKRYIKTYFTCVLLLVGLLSACKEEDMTLGEGSVRLNVKVSDEVAVVSRAIDPGIYASMQTRIYSSKGLIRYYDRENLMPETPSRRHSIPPIIQDRPTSPSKAEKLPRPK